MTQDQLRALIRETVARRLAAAEPCLAAERSGAPPASSTPAPEHASHVIHLTVVNAGDACVIEPDVTCSHCGYCKTHGY